LRLTWGQGEQARQIIPVLKRVEAPYFYIMGNDDNVALDFEDQLFGAMDADDKSDISFSFTPDVANKK
jgi:hypothetical protein